MKLTAPDYYCDFACIAGNCRHSCCIGWEIDIDDETLKHYRCVGGDFGKRLHQSISADAEGAHFILDAQERCPFLNPEGLCDLIIELGEDKLCQICADHPRFRNFYADREEIGLGLCCEAAGQLILSRTEKTSFVVLDDDGFDDELPDEDAELLQLRDELISIAQDRQHSLTERLSILLKNINLQQFEPDPVSWKNFLLQLERLDDGWSDQLEKLTEHSSSNPNTDMEIPFEQLLVYLLMRHINADDDDLSGRIAYCILIVNLIKRMLGDGSLEDMVELARLYSSEIEYSDENMTAIIDELHRLYPEI